MVLFAEKGVTTINDWVQNRNKCLLSLFPWLRVGRTPQKCNLVKYSTTLLILYFYLNYNFLNILANLCLSKRPFEADCFQDYPPPTLLPRQVEIDSSGFFDLKSLAPCLETPIVRHDQQLSNIFQQLLHKWGWVTCLASFQRNLNIDAADICFFQILAANWTINWFTRQLE